MKCYKKSLLIILIIIIFIPGIKADTWYYNQTYMSVKVNYFNSQTPTKWYGNYNLDRTFNLINAETNTDLLNTYDGISELDFHVVGSVDNVYNPGNTYTWTFQNWIEPGLTQEEWNDFVNSVSFNFKGSTTASEGAANEDNISSYSCSLDLVSNNSSKSVFNVTCLFIPTVSIKYFRVQLIIDPALDNDKISYISYVTHTYTTSSNSILLDQNKLINETNDKLNDLNNTITSNSEDFEDEKCGIICKLKNIPKQIGNIIKGLFVPDDFSFIEEFKDVLSNKLGFIASIPIQLIDFALSLSDIAFSEITTISFPSISIFGYHFWDSQEIDISEGLSVFSAFKYITDILCVVLCCNTLYKFYQTFTGGGAE